MRWKMRTAITLGVVALWLVACIGLEGCVPLSRETLVEEAAYQAVAAVDAAETVRIARCPARWDEDNRMLGRHPRSGVVVPYFVAFGAAHLAMTDYLVARHAPDWTIRAWEFVSISYEGRALAINASIGVRP